MVHISKITKEQDINNQTQKLYFIIRKDCRKISYNNLSDKGLEP